jgi:mannose-1-phosphate guanylyltransferase
VSELGEERKRAIARNEALFREVNERVEEVSGGAASETTHFLCECGSADCTQSIALSAREYEQLRSDPLLFAVAPGHEIEDVEDVVSENDRFRTVRKREDAAAIARQTDPRKSPRA